MNELSRSVDIHGAGLDAAAGRLDSQLAELIEVVWACEVAARREVRIDAAIKYGCR